MMKKILTLLLLAITFNSCGGQHAKHEIIDLFVQSVVLNKNESFDKIYDFITIDPLASESEKENLMKIIKLNILEIRTRINSCSSSYDIVSHGNTSGEMLDKYKLEYNDLSSVYYLICDNKIIVPFVIKDEKIIAFFNSIKKTKDQNFKPWMLNQLPN